MEISVDDFNEIAVLFKREIYKILNEKESTDLVDHLLTMPKISCYSLRLSTPRVVVNKEFIPNSLCDEDKKLLKKIFITGQLYFTKSACLYFANKLQQSLDNREAITKLIEICLQETYQRNKTLVARNEFSTLYNQLLPLVSSEEQKNDLLSFKAFFYQLNDIRYVYAPNSSRIFSRLIHTIEQKGSAISLATLAIGIISAGLAIFPPLTPIFGPIALVASLATLSIGLPISLRRVYGMIYNAVIYGAAPTKGEVVNLLLLGVSVATVCFSGILTACVSTGIFGKFAIVASRAEKAVANISRCGFALSAQVSSRHARVANKTLLQLTAPTPPLFS